MIGSFRDKEAEILFRGGKGHRSWQSFGRVARRKLLMVHAANTLNDLKNPPGNKLEALKKERKGQHAIRINSQYRVCFVWRDSQPFDVEIADYHDE